jgi:hypothetical protein
MSDTNTLDLSDLSSEPVESNVQVEITDAPEEVATEEPVDTEEPVATEEAPVETEAPEAPSAPSTEEVVENVKEILSTEPVVSVDTTELQERVKVLEERFDKFNSILLTWLNSSDDGLNWLILLLKDV